MSLLGVSSNNLAKEEKETEGQAPEDIYPHPSVEKRVRASKRRKEENGKRNKIEATNIYPDIYPNIVSRNDYDTRSAKSHGLPESKSLATSTGTSVSASA